MRRYLKACAFLTSLSRHALELTGQGEALDITCAKSTVSVIVKFLAVVLMVGKYVFVDLVSFARMSYDTLR